jgi:hypothetical protein
MPNEDLDLGEVLLQWQAPTIVRHERTKRWYVVAGVFAALCVAYALWSGAWSFALVIAAIVLSYFVSHRSSHVPEVQVAITKNGVLYNGTFTRWNNITCFWLLSFPGWKELHIQKTQGLLREITVQLGDITVPDIRALLSQYTQEHPDQKERLLDRIIRLCKL